MQCFRRSLIGGQVETFNCPGLFDNAKKAYCCGTEMNRYCCKLSKAREHGFRANDGMRVSGKDVLKGVGTALMFVLFVILGCIGLCCFCVCYLCKSKRLSRGVVLGSAPTSTPNEIGGQSVHVVNQPPPTAQYPTAYPQAQQPPPQPGYPMYPTSTPAYPPPPPYPTNDAAKQPAYNPYYPQ